MWRVTHYHLVNTQGPPVGPIPFSHITQPGQLSRVQSIFPTIISRRGSQPLNTDPRNLGDYTLTTLIPFGLSLPGVLSAPARTLDQAACRMALFPNGRVPLMRRIL